MTIKHICVLKISGSEKHHYNRLVNVYLAFYKQTWWYKFNHTCRLIYFTNAGKRSKLLLF